MATSTPGMSEEDRAFLDGLVAKGSFPSVEAALDRAMALLREDEAEMDAFVARLNRAHDQAVRGELAPGTGQEALARAFERARVAYEARHSQDLAAE